ncbi:hypothetical protein [Pararhizobium sp.]|uniref:hypothetical protein n=1 Tax=Pararhizobium sp. TaxID=1977563 RepID=UPI003BACA7B0
MQLPQINVPVDTFEASEARDRLCPGGEIVSVPIVKFGTCARCYFNVAEQVREMGGSIQLGWLLSQLPGAFVEATHHAVWKTPEGNLRDVTERAYPTMRSDFVTFIPDNRITMTVGEAAPLVPPEYPLAAKDEDVLLYQVVMRHRMDCLRQISQYYVQKNAGHALENPVGIRPFDEISNELLYRILAQDRHLDLLRQKILSGLQNLA